MAQALALTPRQIIDELDQDLGLSRRDIAAALDVSERTIERWHAGEAHPQRAARGRLAELAALHCRLRDLFTSVEAVRSWMHASRSFLGGLTPAETIRAGRLDRVDHLLGVIEHGIFA